jgi:hypothetical protein
MNLPLTSVRGGVGCDFGETQECIELHRVPASLKLIARHPYWGQCHDQDART